MVATAVEITFDLKRMEPIEVVGRIRSYLHIAGAHWRKESAYIDDGEVKFDETYVTEHPLIIIIDNLNLDLPEHNFVAQAVASASAVVHRYNAKLLVYLDDDYSQQSSMWLDSLLESAGMSGDNLVLIDTKDLKASAFLS